jgi:hypothetical protein
MKKGLTEDITSAIEIATDLEDVELLARSLQHRARIHMQQKNYALARADAQGAMEYVDRVRAPLKGNIYLASAEANAFYTSNDRELERQVKRWQDQALNLVWKGPFEVDRTFEVLNLAGVHHERAKTLIQFYEYHPKKETLADARDELNMAWKGLTPDLQEWRMYFYSTEAQLYGVEHDIEGSARTGLKALQAARAMQSKKGETQVKALYENLNGIDEVNPYVRNLGLELGIF